MIHQVSLVAERTNFHQTNKETTMQSPLPLRYLRLNTVLDRTGLSRATLYRKIAAGTFPAQYRIAERCCGWREAEVDLWLRNPLNFTIADLERQPA